MLLFAWTAAFAILAALAIIVVLVGLQLAALCFAKGSTARIVGEVIIALLGLAVAIACFWF